MGYTFGSAPASDRRRVQYFELLGNRAIYKDGWMAATRHGIPWKTAGQETSFDADVWELYNIDQDFSQATNVAAQYPARLKELQAAFDEEARRYNVLPLDDRFTQRLDLSLRPNAMAELSSFTYGPGVSYINENSFLNTHNVPFSITAEVDSATGASDGVLAAIGGKTSGWSLYVKDGRPTFYYNFFDVAGYRVQSSTSLPRGKSTVRVELAPEEPGHGKPAAVKLFVDGRQVGAGRVEKTVPAGYGAEGFDVGMDNISPVSPDYKSPFPFSGKIQGVTIAIQK
jgi:arylsulfatase